MKDIFAAITAYAHAYAVLENFQRSADSALPRGDQKTGVIAEFYARLFARHCFQGAELVYGSPSQRAWDITVRRVGSPLNYVQVKAVSSHSTTSRISPIHEGWNELWLFRLDRDFAPEGFWVLDAADCDWSNSTLKASTMPRGTSLGRPFANAKDRLRELIAVLGDAGAPNRMLAMSTYSDLSNDAERETGRGAAATP